jgi:hypothetical protein
VIGTDLISYLGQHWDSSQGQSLTTVVSLYYFYIRQIGHFTIYNASNNASTMLHLSLMLQDFNVTFDEKKNYIHCFAHIVNLCSQVVIKVMEKDNGDVAYSDSDTDPATESLDSDAAPAMMRATHVTKKASPIRRACKTVTFIRKSGQCCDQFLEIISQGYYTDPEWTVSSAEHKTVALACVTVLPNVKTWWDFVFYMLHRLHYLQQAC